MPNRAVPPVTAPALRPSFSNPPTPAEISQDRVFEEPLVAPRATSFEENRALASALRRYLDARSAESLAPL